MEFSVSTPRYRYHYPNPKPNTPTVVLGKKHHSTTFSFKPAPPPNSQGSSNSSPLSNQLRRPKTNPPPPPLPPHPTTPKIPSNRFKNLVNPTHVPTPPIHSNSTALTNKLWLTSKLSPSPPPPPPPEIEDEEEAVEDNEPKKKSDLPKVEFRQEGKIFVGNLPNWVKKHEVSELFWQFGPITNVILIKGHDNTERNGGFRFVIYGGGPNATKSAMKAVEFDGVEFHGRVLTVKLDDGGRLKGKTEERTQWFGGDGLGLALLLYWLSRCRPQ